MKKLWHDSAWRDYEYWQSQDKKTLRRINVLIKEIDRNGYACAGKPEALKGDLSGMWSVRIDRTNRLVFMIDDGNLVIFSCRGHYGS